MKLAIVTFHRANNYGAVLQCYALNRAMLNKGIDCEVLDYAPGYFTRMYRVLPKKTLTKRGIKTLLCHVLLRKMLKARNEKFADFVSCRLKLSAKTFDTPDEADLTGYDAVITGSDQVWNPTAAEFDRIFFLYGKGFENLKKYSYAASFGLDKLPEHLTEEYQNRLNDYCRISVREKSAVPIVEALTGKAPVVSCDPTFLLSADDWKALAGEKPLVPGDYIFLYYVKQPKEIRAYAKKLAAQTKCRVICTSCYFTKVPGTLYRYMGGKADAEDGFETMNAVSPDEFLNLILHAKYVLCSSFHGTVFSILFEKRFLSQTVWGDGSKNDRVENLLALAGLSHRTISSPDAAIDTAEDWKAVGSRIDVLRNDGHQYLETIVTDDREA